MGFIPNTLPQAQMITGFVFIMMVLIEHINVMPGSPSPPGPFEDS